MVKVINNRRCVICGQRNVQLWTVDNTQHAGVAYLCVEHGAPLQEILEAAGELAPDEQIPLPERHGEMMPQVYVKGKRSGGMIPLLDWTPPTEYE